MLSLSGIVGSFLSLSIRNDEISLPISNVNKVIHLQAFVKLITGMISGCVIYLGIQSNIILGIAGKEIFAMCLFGFIAGFSERFIPELVDNVKRDSA